MFNSLFLCIAVGIIISTYFILKQKSKKEQLINKTSSIELQEKGIEEKTDKLVSEEDKKNRLIEIGGFILITYIISSLFASQTNGDGLSYKIGFWFGNLVAVIVAAGAFIGILYIIKGKPSFRLIMNTIWVVTGIVFFILSCAF